MEGKQAFQRIFLIFGNEDTGYEAGQKPSGHVRIEVRDSRGKLTATIQNLKQENERFNYKLYLIKSQAGVTVPVCAGRLQQKLNKTELEWDFNPLNVSMTGRSIEEFGIAAVLAEYTDKTNTKVICPLAAYRDKRTEWRDRVGEFLYKNNAYNKPEGDMVSKYTGLAESKYIPPENNPDFNIPAGYQANKFDTGNEAYIEPYYQPEKQTEVQLQQEVQNLQEMQPQMQPDMQSVLQPQMQPQNTLGGIDTNCLYLNSNMCGMYLQNNGINPCENCTVNHQAAPENDKSRQDTGDIERLKYEMEKHFTKSDPFHSQRSDYIWWKVANPVNLNNILYQCNIRSPLLFNPQVMMAHFKYRHLILGIYTDRARKIEYVVCGVPGMYMVDKKPFGDMCRWVQSEGNRSKYGSFGYFIVYIDPLTGKILNVK